MAQDLKLQVVIDPNQEPPITSPGNRPSAFTGGLFERYEAFKNMAVVGYLGYAGKQVFDKVKSGVGSATGRTDIQRKINRVNGAVGTVLELGGGFAIGGLVGVGAVAVKQATTFATERITEQITLNIDRQEAEFRRELRGALINRSRSR